MAIFVLLVFAIILFIIWQFHVFYKYQFKCDVIQIRKQFKQLVINKKIINFTDIKEIEIFKDDVQPSIWERALSKGAFFVYNTVIRIYLKDDTIDVVKSNSRALINKIINELQPYTNIVNNTDNNTEYGKTVALSFIIGLIFVLIMGMLCFIPH